MNVPILTITGHYDGDQPGALHYYRQFMEYASPEARQKHYLIVGPWDHAGTRTPNAQVGGLTFGAASVLDLNALHKAWYDWTMKAGAKPEFLKDKVAFYVVGEEAWRYAPTLDAVTARAEPWYLDSVAGRANDVFAAGSLDKRKPSGNKPDSYVYDPLDTSPAEWESVDVPNGLTDQRGMLNSSGKMLVYHTPPFAADTDIAGFFKLSAWLSLDQPDTDFIAAVYEIKSDGSSVSLSDDLLRARYRKSFRDAEPVKSGAVERYDFDHFTFQARRIAKGSRLRLILAPINSQWSQKNYNTGGVVSNESGKDARKVTVTLYHDASHPSTLYVPLAAASSVHPK
jgi:putative CocE/NonD family hydrolase